MTRPGDAGPGGGPAGRWLRWAVLTLLAALAFLPVGPAVYPALRLPLDPSEAGSWMAWTLLLGVLALPLARLWDRLPDRVRDGLRARLPGGAGAAVAQDRGRDRAGGVGAGDRLPLALLVGGAAALFLAVTLLVFDGRPLHIDALTQAFQARLLAAGRLWEPSPTLPEFSSTLLVVDDGTRTYPQFPPGWAALLAAGYLVGAPWLVAPAVGALTVAASYLLFRALGEARGASAAAASLLALSPWFAFGVGSQMNHVAATLWIVLASAALVHALAAPPGAPPDRNAGPAPAAGGPRPGWRSRTALWTAVAGAALGLAATVRPLDALAFALPAAAWLAVRVRRGRGLAEVGGFAAGLAAPTALLLSYNALLHGSPLTFGYEIQWGATHGLGFHEAPWGPPHTPARGLALVNLYLLRLQQVLFESPAPGLLPAFAALWLVPRLAPGDRYLLGGSLLLLLGYFLYWHEGEYLGPRFLLPLAPVVVLWTVRLPRAVAGVAPGGSRASGWAAALVVLLVASGLLLGVPGRWSEYASMQPQRRVDLAAAAREAGVRNAVVLVPGAWGSQVLARLWAVGLERRRAQWLYERADLCRLELALSEVERRSLRGAAADAALAPLAADSLELVASVHSSDEDQRMLAGARYPPLCATKAALERVGTFPYPVALLATGYDGNVFLRDLNEGNRRLLDRLPDASWWLVRPVQRADGSLGARMSPLDLDSARIAWSDLATAAAATSPDDVVSGSGSATAGPPPRRGAPPPPP